MVGPGARPYPGDSDEPLRRALTADDIEEATFRTSAFGYRRRDVDALLAAIAEDLRAGAAERGLAVRDERPLGDVALSLEAAERIRHDAERDARAIVQTATEAAQAILLAARRSYEEAERKAEELLEVAQGRTREFAERALDCQRVLLALADAVGRPLDPALAGSLPLGDPAAERVLGPEAGGAGGPIAEADRPEAAGGSPAG